VATKEFESITIGPTRKKQTGSERGGRFPEILLADSTGTGGGDLQRTLSRGGRVLHELNGVFDSDIFA